MPSSSIIIPFRNLLSVLLLLPLVLSCRQDELILPVPPVSGKGETAEVTLSVRIPDFRAQTEEEIRPADNLLLKTKATNSRSDDGIG